MSFMHLAEIIQANLGYTPIKKIDPNTSEPKEEASNDGSGAIAQAGIPVIILGLMNYMAINSVKGENLDGESLDQLFGDKKTEIISRVAVYSGNSTEQTKHELNFILKEAIRVVREMNKENASSLHDFVVVQKRDAILFLPDSLHAGLLLGDSRIDDKTNKMEGPFSNAMHSIEEKFS
jgi:hypothetical protein